MKHRGYPVREHLPIGLEQRDIHSEVDTRTWHQLALECITVNIDDAGQDKEAACVDPQSRATPSTDDVDHAIISANGRVFELISNKNATAVDTNIHHKFCTTT